VCQARFLLAAHVRLHEIPMILLLLSLSCFLRFGVFLVRAVIRIASLPLLYHGPSGGDGQQSAAYYGNWGKIVQFHHWYKV
jgi:hypothetical protein